VNRDNFFVFTPRLNEAASDLELTTIVKSHEEAFAEGAAVFLRWKTRGPRSEPVDVIARLKPSPTQQGEQQGRPLKTILFAADGHIHHKILKFRLAAELGTVVRS
jgi:hypothetical protein